MRHDLLTTAVAACFVLLNALAVAAQQPNSATVDPIPADRSVSGRAATAKSKLLKKYGGTAESQTAVADGLQWLKRNQRNDGGWSIVGPFADGAMKENRSAATAMAMLAIMGDGHTHRHGDFIAEMVRAKTFLVGLQNGEGLFKDDNSSHERMYAQALATIAICEIYSMTKDPELLKPAQLAVDYAQNAQSDQGGWRYTPRRGEDTSVTSWFVQALCAGRDAGLRVNNDKLQAVHRYLDMSAHRDGAAYGYLPKYRPTASMSAAGLLCRQQLGWKRDNPAIVKGVKSLLDDATPFKSNPRDIYYWNHASQAIRHVGGDSWQQFNELMLKDLPAKQVKDGDERGSWPPQSDKWKVNGRLFTTCFSIWCLESYYRNLSVHGVDSP